MQFRPGRYLERQCPLLKHTSYDRLLMSEYEDRVVFRVYRAVRARRIQIRFFGSVCASCFRGPEAFYGFALVGCAALSHSSWYLTTLLPPGRLPDTIEQIVALIMGLLDREKDGLLRPGSEAVQVQRTP